MIKAILFDMDGVLIDSELVYMNELKQYLELQGYHYTMKNLFAMIGTTNKTTFEMVAKEANVGKCGPQIQEEYFSYLASIAPFDDYLSILNPKVKETLETLKNKGYHLAVASSNSLHHIHHVLKQCQIDHYFESIISGEMFKESKPHPEIYLYSAKQLHVEPHECIVVEDSYYGIQAGKSAGMKVLAIKDQRFNIDQTQADAHVIEFSEILNHLS